MNYINNQTMEYPISLFQIQEANPYTIMPQYLQHYSVVLNSDIPAYDHLRQKVVEGSPVLAPDGTVRPEDSPVKSDVVEGYTNDLPTLGDPNEPDDPTDPVEPSPTPAPVYMQVWEIVDLPKDEADANIAAWEEKEKQANFIQVTKRQALIALFVIKKIKDSDVLAAIEGIPDEDDRYMARISWEGAASIDNQSPFTAQVGALLELTEDDMTSLFNYARTQ